MYTLTLSIILGGVSPPSMSSPRPSASIAPLSPSARVVQPLEPCIIVHQYSWVVPRIPSSPFTSPSFMQSAQSGPSGSTSFVQGFP